MEQQLEELEQMLSALEAQETSHHLAHMTGHKELQTEIDHLREQMERLGIQHGGAAGGKTSEGEAGAADEHANHDANVNIEGASDGGHTDVEAPAATADPAEHNEGHEHAAGGSDESHSSESSEGAEGSDKSGSAGGAEASVDAPAAAEPATHDGHAASEEHHVAHDVDAAETPGAAGHDSNSIDAPKAVDVDMQMPYGDLEPFGREDTAQELTEDSIRQSNGMVDQLERAEVAEEKRAVFRALTRLRGSAITSYDGIARSQTGNIDDYARTNQWRTAHPVHHLANDEADVAKWAFPEDSHDF